MQRLLLATVAGLFFTLPAAADEEDRPIPQNPEWQKQRYADMLSWNRRTLAGAYDKVGKKSPRWDKAAHEALEAAARCFSFALDPAATYADMHAPAKRALDAGCDDPLILYLYARSSYGPDYPGKEELERRYSLAAAAMEHSKYPPGRRITAFVKAALAKADLKHAPEETGKEAARLLDAAVALLPRSLQEDEKSLDRENLQFELPMEVIEGHRKLGMDYQAAFDHVDAMLARTPALKAIRLQTRGAFLIRYAWEARGSGFANTVTEEGWRKFHERLTEARRTLEEAWKVKPGDHRTATLMLTVEKGIGGDREEMEKWFERAMKADGNNQRACEAKLDWLDPKWHGTLEEMLAFGRACRDTKNWRTGITLLIAQAHHRATQRMTPAEARQYWHSEEVRNDIRSVYEEYLKHYPNQNVARSEYAGYCALCGLYAEADKQFKILGDKLVYNRLFFPEKWMKQTRAYVAAQMKNEKAQVADKPQK